MEALPAPSSSALERAPQLIPQQDGCIDRPGFKIRSFSEQQVTLSMVFFPDFSGFSAIGKGLSPLTPDHRHLLRGAQGLCQARAQPLPHCAASFCQQLSAFNPDAVFFSWNTVYLALKTSQLWPYSKLGWPETVLFLLCVPPRHEHANACVALIWYLRRSYPSIHRASNQGIAVFLLLNKSYYNTHKFLKQRLVLWVLFKTAKC